MNLLEIGTDTQVAALRSFLAAAAYRESRICEKLGLASAEALDMAAFSYNLKERVTSPEPLNTLIRLFLLGEFVPISEAEAQFPGSAWAAMNALGLIEDDRSHCIEGGDFTPQDFTLTNDYPCPDGLQSATLDGVPAGAL